MLSQLRIGRFTSSEIHNLMKNGRGLAPSVATLSYIEEKRMEKRLGRSLNADLSTRPTVWGHVCEQRLNSLLDPLEYDYCSDQTLVHQEIIDWAGTPDFITADRVVDAKCPYTLKGFCQLADIAVARDVEALKTKKPEYYWQLISNAILTNKSKAELIAYCPYQNELQAIRELVENSDDSQNKYAWIYFAEDEDLPYLIEGRYYQNMYRFVFEVPATDKALLTDAVIKASEQLQEVA